MLISQVVLLLGVCDIDQKKKKMRVGDSGVTGRNPHKHGENMDLHTGPNSDRLADINHCLLIGNYFNFNLNKQNL